ncbi:MAG: hypothetical protein PHW52_04405 [Candidatus Pacebacteria bacterium]|nr:hypothetical protein [Candidatus Paceibacterota bacterium]
MDQVDKEIFLNIFLGIVSIDKGTTPEAVHGALMKASGVIINPIVISEDIPMYCAASIANAINNDNFSDFYLLMDRVAIGVQESIKKRRGKRKHKG